MGAPVTLEQLHTLLTSILERTEKIEKHLEKLNGSVGDQHARLAVLEDWRRCAGQQAIDSMVDIKVELARLAVKTASITGTATLLVTLIAAMLKVFGVI